MFEADPQLSFCLIASSYSCSLCIFFIHNDIWRSLLSLIFFFYLLMYIILILRALKTINFREESEKLNIWVAYFNLENEHGNPPEVFNLLILIYFLICFSLSFHLTLPFYSWTFFFRRLLQNCSREHYSTVIPRSCTWPFWECMKELSNKS